MMFFTTCNIVSVYRDHETQKMCAKCARVRHKSIQIKTFCLSLFLYALPEKYYVY